MKSCVVLSTQRSGSTLLVDYLSSAPGVLIHSELFQNLRPDLIGQPNAPRHYGIAYQTYRKSTLPRKLAHRFRRAALIEKFLGHIYAPKRDIDVIGMKFMYNQARKYPEVLTWLKAHDVFFIHLVRDNLLDMIISQELALKRGTYSMLKPLEMVKIRLDTDSLLAELQKASGEVEYFREFCASRQSHEVTYEALVADKAGEARKILDRLGAQTAEPAGSNLRKTNVSAPQEVIENYDAVAEALAAHPKFRRYIS